MIRILLGDLWAGRMEIIRTVVLVAIILGAWNLGAYVERRRWRRDPARLNAETRELLREALYDAARYKRAAIDADAMVDAMRNRLRVGTAATLHAAQLLGGEPANGKTRKEGRDG